MVERPNQGAESHMDDVVHKEIGQSQGALIHDVQVVV
jgi:hypothetical protein